VALLEDNPHVSVKKITCTCGKQQPFCNLKCILCGKRLWACEM